MIRRRAAARTGDGDLIDRRASSVLTAGRPITLERWAPVSPVGAVSRHRVMILGGCSPGPDLLLERELAQSIATAGASATIVDYLAASSAGPGTFCAPTDAAIAELPAVVGAVADAARSLHEGSGDIALGVVGYSFGGLLALYAQLGRGPAGELPQTTFASIALLAVPVYREVLDGARSRPLPPLLIAHGDRDHAAPVTQADLLRRAASDGGALVRLQVIEAMDHGWSGTRRKQVAARRRVVPLITEFILRQGR
ncbi:MAG: alpha/beta hydrolase family protein [Ilumatobacteraceae bacterium]